MNPDTAPASGIRVQVVGPSGAPICATTTGADGTVGVSWSMSNGAEELAAALRARRHGLLAASLLAPALIGLAVAGFAVALLVGQPLYLLLGMGSVPAGFIVTPILMLRQAVASLRKQG